MTFRLPRLPAQPTSHSTLQLYWQRLVEAIEAQEAAQNQVIADLTQAVADIQTARKQDARHASYPSPTNVLTATDAGTNATIAIAAHTRVYPGGVVSNVSIGAASLTGLAYSTRYYVYYDDATMASTTPTFLTTTTAATAQVGAGTSRHFVGEITTPASGAGSTTGSGGAPPGGGQIP